MRCSSCNSHVGVFSSEWQHQRDLKIKKCPFCSKEVEAVFSGAVFVKWLVGLWVAIAAITFLISQSESFAFSSGLVLGILAALFLSLELRSPSNPGKNFLNRSVELPNWLKPPTWFVNFASLAWTVGSYLFILIALTFGVPFPWSALLLVVLGAIGLLHRTSPSKGSRVASVGSKVGATSMLVLGVGLFAYRYF